MDTKEETEILAQQFYVVLGGEKRCVRERRMVELDEFTDRVADAVASVLEFFEKEIEAYIEKTGLKEIEWDNLGELDVLPFIRRALPWAIRDRFKTVMELLWAYAPDLKEFEEGATEEEIVTAALEVCDRAFPLFVRIAKPVIAYIRQRLNRRQKQNKAKASRRAKRSKPQ